jgi:hypothetical protein
MEIGKKALVEQQAVTPREIGEIVGELEPATIESIIATGATREEVLEAYAWLSADDSLHRELHRTLHGTVARVYEILETEIVAPNDR